MTLHVLPGDSLIDEFRKTKIPGEIIVCRECLIVGPTNGDSPSEFWAQRGRFILAEYGEDEIEYQERVADEMEKLSDIDTGTEVNLWFEYELFCSVNLWFCLSLLKASGAVVYRVEPAVLDPDDRWKGFGNMDAEDLQRCYAARKRLDIEDIVLGSGLWDACRNDDRTRLAELSASPSDRFPHLKDVCDAAIEKDTLPLEIVDQIRSEGHQEFEDVFAEFSLRAGVYGYGDLQVQRLIETLDK